MDKYTERLSGKTTMYIKQIMMVLKRLDSSASLLLATGFMEVAELLERLKLAHVNLFKIISFMKESGLSNKV